MYKELLASNKINNMASYETNYGNAVETMIEAELTKYLDYEKHKVNVDSYKRNDTTVRSTYRAFGISIPRNHEGSFELIIVEK